MPVVKYKFEVTKTFLSGPLSDITIVEHTSVAFVEGFVCDKPIGSSSYRIDKVVRVG